MSFFLRTSQVLQASLMGLPLEIFSGRLPQSGTMRNGHIYARLMRARRIAGNAGSAWPTARATMGALYQPSADKPHAGGGLAKRLEVEVGRLHWPTPTSQNAKHAAPTEWEQENRAGHLHVLAAWPTPAAQDSKNATLPPSQGERDTLPGEILRQWATPQAFDANQINCSPEALERAKEVGGCSNLREQVSGALNPDWVETLMGYPSGWTDISSPLPQEALNIQQSRRALRHMLKIERRGSKHSVTRLYPKSSTRLHLRYGIGLR